MMISKGHDDLKTMLTSRSRAFKKKKSFKNSASFCPFIRSHFKSSRPQKNDEHSTAALFLRKKNACIIIFTSKNDMLCENNPSGGCRNKTRKDERLSKEKNLFSSSSHTLIVIIGRISDDSDVE